METRGDSPVEVRVLGPVEVVRDGRPVPLGPRLTELLCALVAAGGRPVPAARLVELLWPDGPPAAATLRSHVAHLRRALGHSAVGTVNRVLYRLDLPPDAVDARRFEDAVAGGRFAAALALWRGPAYAGLADRPHLRPEAERLDGLRRRAVRGHAGVLTGEGRPAEAAALLAGVVAEEPYDEGARRELVLALYAAERVDEAADACREGITVLRERGHEAPGLRQLHLQVLRRKVPAAVPRLLPPAPPRLAGRDDDAGRARAVLAGRPALLVVTGPPGVGKTSLAVHVGHSLVDDFPDGQLFADLRGFDAAGPAADAADALHGLLDALGVPPARVPAGLPARAGLYRELLADRRMLVVLDDARDAGQVRPLLPGARGCAVLVTSRGQLPELLAADGARVLTLDVIPPGAARALLASRIGDHRVTAEPAAVEEITARCAGLPLALALVAARAALHPAFPLRALADELADPDTRLDALAAVFAASHRALSAGAARLFRLLGLGVGPSVTPAAAASLAGRPVAEVRPLLAELAAAHLLTEPAPGRYGWHDLLRAYAGRLSRSAPAGALRRLLDHYLLTAHAAERLLLPYRDPITVARAGRGVTVPPLADADAATAWLAANRAALLPAVDAARDAGLDVHAWQLAWSLTTFLHRRGRWDELAHALTVGLDAAQRLGDGAAQAQLHRELALALSQLGQHDEARTHLRRAGRLFAAQDDPTGQASTLLYLGWLSELRGARREALEHDERALTLFRAAGHKAGQARALNAVGWDHAQLGEYDRAVERCREALSLHQALGNGPGEARAWDSLGFARHHLGDHGEAVECFERALELYRRDDDRYCEAETLTHLGDTHRAAGDPSAATAAWRAALTILDALGHPDAAGVRARLT